MHTDTRKKMPARGGNPTAGDTDSSIVAGTAARVKAALLAIGAALAAIFGGLQ